MATFKKQLKDKRGNNIIPVIDKDVIYARDPEAAEADEPWIENSMVQQGTISVDKLKTNSFIYFNDSLANNNVNSDTWYNQYNYKILETGLYYIIASQRLVNGTASYDMSLRILNESTEEVISTNTSGGGTYTNYIEVVVFGFAIFEKDDILKIQSTGGGTGVFQTQAGKISLARIA